MNAEERQALESKKLKLRLFLVLLVAAFFVYLLFVRPALKAAI